jgi:hypothetical protein
MSNPQIDEFLLFYFPTSFSSQKVTIKHVFTRKNHSENMTLLRRSEDISDWKYFGQLTVMAVNIFITSNI